MSPHRYCQQSWTVILYIGTESQIQLRMLKSVVDDQCPPPELVDEKLLIPLIANRTGNLKFLKFSSSC